MLAKTATAYPLAAARPRVPSMVRFLPYLAPFRWYFIMSFALAPVGVGLTIAMPLLLGAAIDGPMTAGDAIGVLWYAIVLLLVGAAEAGCALVRRWVLARSTSQIEADIRLDLFDKLQHLSLDFHKSWESGQLLSRIMNDLGQLRRFMAFGVVVLFICTMQILAVAVLMIATLWQAGLGVVAASVPVILASYALLARLGPLSRRVQDETGDVASAAQEALHGLRVIRSFGRAGHMSAAFERHASKLADSGIQRVNLAAILWALLEVFPAVLLVIVLIGIAGGISAGTISTGEAVTFVTLLLSLAGPVGGMGFLLTFARETDTAADRIVEIFDAPIQIVSGRRRIEQVRGKIELRDVVFQFDDAEHPTLRGVNLVVEPGETVALVGGTGSGKSSLIALIPRLMDVTSGQVLIDGIDVRELELTQLRGLIGTAFEDPILFSMSARENLTLGREEATEDEIAEAVQIARAEFVYELPWGLETRLGEQGLSLSGGQRQRLALARAILVKPKILLLDDTLSALDIHTEAEVEEALRATLTGVSGIVVAHRASTVLLADKVALLQAGQITHIGTHHELLTDVAEYRELLSADYAIEPGMA